MLENEDFWTTKRGIGNDARIPTVNLSATQRPLALETIVSAARTQMFRRLTVDPRSAEMFVRPGAVG
jgi:hypothetical protein